MESMDNAIQEMEAAKRRKRIIVIVLVAVAVLAMIITNSGVIKDVRKLDAENVYYLLRSVVSKDYSDGTIFADLGRGTAEPAEFSKDIYVIYNMEDQEFIIQGINMQDQGEQTRWKNVNSKNGLGAIIGICSNWHQFEGRLGEGYTLTVKMVLDKEAGQERLIRNSEEAAEFIQSLKELNQSMTKE